ncbi:MAG: hypothetical protein HKL96_04265 [Phycisphaerales bacterium]|nr:hypothetical protein [Phycisphaerales bacterium]
MMSVFDSLAHDAMTAHDAYSGSRYVKINIPVYRESGVMGRHASWLTTVILQITPLMPKQGGWYEPR